jgi:hypothetical protein
MRLQSRVNRRVRGQPCWARATLQGRNVSAWQSCIQRISRRSLCHHKLSYPHVMVSSQYRYESLSDECFRLFCIRSTGSELIEIHLFEADFKSPLAFEAVSYAWGAGKAISTILCNGQHLSVSSNVEAILRRLRQKASVGLFWIDSICTIKRRFLSEICKYRECALFTARLD